MHIHLPTYGTLVFGLVVMVPAVCSTLFVLKVFVAGPTLERTVCDPTGLPVSC